MNMGSIWTFLGLIYIICHCLFKRVELKKSFNLHKEKKDGIVQFFVIGILLSTIMLITWPLFLAIDTIRRF